MKKTVLILAIGAALGAVAVPGSAQEAIRSVFGAYLSHVTEERIDISIGVTRTGDPVREDRVVEVRDTIVVPQHFGAPIAVTAADGGAVLWYQDKDGGVRNVIISDAAKRLYLVEPTPSRLVAEIPRPR